jgi:hypothetical protein
MSVQAAVRAGQAVAEVVVGLTPASVSRALAGLTPEVGDHHLKD